MADTHIRNVHTGTITLSAHNQSGKDWFNSLVIEFGQWRGKNGWYSFKAIGLQELADDTDTADHQVL